MTPAAIEALQGQALARAQMPLEAIVAGLPQPGCLAAGPAPAPAATAPATQPPGVELDHGVPLAAQRAYLAGRTAWRRGQVYDAIRHFNQALADAPQQPDILRSLGAIHLTALNNRVRGSAYLEQALQINPADIDALYLLARSELDRGEANAALVLFAHALELKVRPSDPALLPLMRHFLGSILQRQGHDQAAADQYVAYLDAPTALSRTSRFLRELYLLSQDRAETWQTVGDLRLRLGRLEEGLAAYERSAEIEPAQDRPALVARLVYCRLRLGEVDAAIQQALGLLRKTRGAPAAAALVEYLAQVGVAPTLLAPAVLEVYRAGPRSEDLALSLAQLVDPPQALAALREHLQADPAALRVFALLLKLELAGTGGVRSGAPAVRLAADAIEAFPRGARSYADILVEQLDGPEAVAAAVESLPPAERQRPGVAFLHAVAVQAAGRTEAALEWFAAALNSSPPLEAARLELVRLLLEQKQYARAESLLEAAPVMGPELTALRIRLLEETRRPDQALRLLDEALAQSPDNVDLVLAKANLLARSGRPEDAAAAERLLWEAVDRQPRSEPLYAALFRLYDQGRTAEVESQRLRLVRRAMQNLPASRLTRLRLAEQQIRAQEIDDAVRLLNALLAEKADDYVALELWLIAQRRSGRGEEARSALEARLKTHPDDRALLALAQRFYAGDQKQERFLQITERLLNLEPPSASRSQKLALLYLRTDRAAEAVELLTPWTREDLPEPQDVLALLGRALLRTGQAARIDDHFQAALVRYPGRAAELRFEWAMLCERRGQKQRSLQMLEQVLQADPRHAQAANALGYACADQGVDLDRAQTLIVTALLADASNPAYLDSLGWVYYKLGRFDKAVELLTKARMQPGGDHAVILAHLGDALWRAGRQEEAVRYWQAARQALTPAMLAEDPETEALSRTLPEKLAAVEARRDPPLAPLAPPATSAATRPATAPAP